MVRNRMGKTFEAKRLTSTGCGIWKYDAAGADVTAVGESGFFATAFERYGMRPGDVVIVNAGDGNVFLVGV
ncbi:MAG: hypothetical protein LIP28_06865 [Deltaproteobacteria bacterium]|nr:hypothetical protein [Deltaproteobacteria bacterium]